MTRVTITLPVYNGMPYLKAAVESVLGQSYRDFRFLIIDDGSFDGSAEYLKSLSDPRVRVISRKNRGLGTTLNELFAESATEYVVRMDCDDICAVDRLRSLLAFLERNTDVVMVGSDYAFLVGSKTLRAAPRPIEHGAIRRRLLQMRAGILHPTIVVRRDAWEEVGGYRLSGAGEDVDFCLRLCDAGRVANVPEVLYYYRLHPTSVSNSRRRELNRGYGYGVACALARQRGEPEPDIDDYWNDWESRSIQLKVGDRLGDIGQRLYREAIMRRLQGRPIQYCAYLLGAATVQPLTAAKRLLKV